jgi:hypothetical protein
MFVSRPSWERSATHSSLDGYILYHILAKSSVVTDA